VENIKVTFLYSSQLREDLFGFRVGLENVFAEKIEGLFFYVY